ncbi:PQQ-binding-like beta-propeller repeat protein [Puerhibacterium sp. TATVAM-FAB25]|uniref:outer membrane protein assembly factor BamB family protein n=1 Tax=Puerhibacterium sp. TATVAM-FAB25 TaxID=3093699 RepID=UPI00397C60E2
MAPRRGSDGPLTFELVPDDEGDGGAPGRATPSAAEDRTTSRTTTGLPGGAGAADAAGDALGAEEEPPGPLGRARGRLAGWASRQPRGRVVAAGAVAAALVVSTGVATSVAEQHRLDRLAASPGGIVDLSAPPTTTWRFAPGADLWPVAQLDGLLVVAEAGGAEDPDAAADWRSQARLHALDPENGEERWSLDVAGVRACGTTMSLVAGDVPRLDPVDELVCVQRADDGWAVLVLDGDGEVQAQRALEGVDEVSPVFGSADSEEGDAVVVTPTADGGLVRAQRVGERGRQPGLVEEGEDGTWVPDGAVKARDVHVVVEDAVTGDLRWETTLPAERVTRDGWYPCATWSEDGTEPGPLEDGTLQVTAGATMLSLAGCGMDAQLTPDGVRLDRDWPAEGDDAPERDETVRTEAVVATVGGGYAVPSRLGSRDDDDAAERDGEAWTLLGADTAVVGELAGPLMDPWASDGTDAGVALSPSGGRLVAQAADDAERAWDAELASPVGVLAQAGGTVLAMGQDSRMVALDARTGAELWSSHVGTGSGDVFGAGTEMGAYVHAVYTDGHRAVVVTPGWSDGGSGAEWTAYELRTGDVAWRQDMRDGYALVLPIDGHLVRWDGATVEGLG